MPINKKIDRKFKKQSIKLQTRKHINRFPKKHRLKPIKAKAQYKISPNYCLLRFLFHFFTKRDIDYDRTTLNLKRGKSM